MRNLIIYVAVFVTAALTLAGCAFDKLSIDKGAFNPKGLYAPMPSSPSVN